jgi:hypothetical protein
MPCLVAARKCWEEQIEERKGVQELAMIEGGLSAGLKNVVDGWGKGEVFRGMEGERDTMVCLEIGDDSRKFGWTNLLFSPQEMLSFPLV